MSLSDDTTSRMFSSSKSRTSQACSSQALCELHAIGWVHRDEHPSNIMTTCKQKWYLMALDCVVNWAFRCSFLVILVTAISLTTCGDTSEMLEFVHCGLSNKSAGGYFGSRLPSIR